MKKNLLVFTLLVILIISCSKDDVTGPTKTEEVIEAIEEIRVSMETELGHIVPSINVYIQTRMK